MGLNDSKCNFDSPSVFVRGRCAQAFQLHCVQPHCARCRNADPICSLTATGEPTTAPLLRARRRLSATLSPDISAAPIAERVNAFGRKCKHPRSPAKLRRNREHRRSRIL